MNAWYILIGKTAQRLHPIPSYLLPFPIDNSPKHKWLISPYMYIWFQWRTVLRAFYFTAVEFENVIQNSAIWPLIHCTHNTFTHLTVVALKWLLGNWKLR